METYGVDGFDTLMLSLLADAVETERLAYASMRAAVPEMGLPAQRRGTLSGDQQVAVARYDVAHARLHQLRRGAPVHPQAERR